MTRIEQFKKIQEDLIHVFQTVYMPEWLNLSAKNLYTLLWVCFLVNPEGIQRRQSIDKIRQFLTMTHFCMAGRFYDNMLSTQRLEKLYGDCLETFVKKNSDYGDSFSIFGYIGVIVRLCDKLKRVDKLESTKDPKVTDETIIDTYLDAVNYTFLAFILLDEAEKLQTIDKDKNLNVRIENQVKNTHSQLPSKKPPVINGPTFVLEEDVDKKGKSRAPDQ